MECFYINLRQQTARRELLERNFSDCKRQGWYLNRVEALTKEQAARTAGTIREAEKACFLSHCQALRDACEAPGHAMILEDDAMFGPNTCASIEKTLQSIGDDNWDLIYTNVGVTELSAMARLLYMRRHAESSDGNLVLLDAKTLGFAGADAYIVNERAKEKLLDLIDVRPLDIQYDLFLRELVVIEKLRGLVIVPFPTTLSPLADETQIQHPIAGSFARAVNSFRHLVWADRTFSTVAAELDMLPPDLVDEESALFGRIASALMARNLVPDIPGIESSSDQAESTSKNSIGDRLN